MVAVRRHTVVWLAFLLPFVPVALRHPPNSRIEIVKELKPCSLKPEQTEQTQIDHTAAVATSGCKMKLSISMKIQNVGKTFTKSQFILVDSVYDSTLKKEVKLLNTVILKIRQEEVTVAYPFQYMYFVNNKAYEFIVHKDNKKQYNGCYGDDSIRRMCGGNERVNSVIQGFCCSCSNDSSETYHVRGGQTCSDGERSDGLHASTHCLLFDPLWYSVNSLGTPRIQHAIHISVYVDGIAISPDIRVGTDSQHSSLKNKKMRAKYTVLSMRGALADDLSTMRLLIPELVTTTREKERRVIQLQGGPEEFLLVDQQAINRSGTMCNKVGVSYQAFTAQTNRCQHQAHRCLDNQPMHLWLHDKQKSIEMKNGSFFLKFWGALPQTPVVRNKETHLKLLLFQFMPAFISHLHIEVAADDVKKLQPGLVGSITRVWAVAGSVQAAVTVAVLNTGPVSSHLTVQLADCRPHLTSAVVTSHTVAPHQTHTFNLQVALQSDEYADGQLTCIVELLNDDQNLISSRLLAYRLHDTCVCMGHCQCVCLSRGSLKCVHLQQDEYAAAGFTDSMPVLVLPLTRWHQQLIYSAMIGIFVIFTLLFLGSMKIAGDRLLTPEIGSFGLSSWNDEPFSQYYERELRSQPVVYNSAGDPVNPVTGMAVYRMSPMKQDLLNLVFFFGVPLLCIRCATRFCCGDLPAWLQAERSDSSSGQTSSSVRYSALVQDLSSAHYGTPAATELSRTAGGMPARGARGARGARATDCVSATDRLLLSSDDELSSDASTARQSLLKRQRKRHPSDTTSTTSTTTLKEFGRAELDYFSSADENRNASSNANQVNPLVEYQIQQLNKLVDARTVVFYNFTAESLHLKNSGKEFSLCGKLSYNRCNMFTFSLGIYQLQVHHVEMGCLQALPAPLPIRAKYFRRRLTAKDVYECVTQKPLFRCLNRLHS